MTSTLSHNLKRVVAGVLALTLVAGSLPANAGTEWLFAKNGTSITAYAESTKTALTVSDITVANGDEAEIVIMMDYDTTDTVVGVSFSLYLPDNILLKGFDTKEAQDAAKASALKKACDLGEGGIWGEDVSSGWLSVKQKTDGGLQFNLIDQDDKTPFESTSNIHVISIHVHAVADVSDTATIKDITIKNDDGSSTAAGDIADVTFGINKSAHTHSFTYDAEGATITASCDEDNCDLKTDPTLTIVAPTMTVSGGTGSAATTLDGLEGFNTATGNNITVENIKYVGRDGTELAETSEAPTKAGKYTAKITVGDATASVDYSIKATLTFETYGGTPVPEQQILEVDEWPDEPDDPAKEGQYFGGWYEDPDLEEPYYFTRLSESMTVYAKWGSNKVTWLYIIPDAADPFSYSNVFTGEAPAADSNEYANIFKSLINLVIEGGALSDWETSTDEKGNVTYTTTAEYTVTLNTNGGTVNEGDVTTYLYGKGATLPTDVTKEDARFAGWYDNADFTGTPVTEIGATDSGIKEYWAKWDQAISQTVTFKVENGSWDDETTEDKSVTLNGYDGDTLKLSEEQIPAVGTKPDEEYLPGSWDITPSTETEITEATTYTYTYAHKDASAVTTAPTAKTLTYNGQEQELVTAGTAENGTMVYAIGTADGPDEAYTSYLPTAAKAGTYYVWYKSLGDETHLDSKPASVIVSIAKADPEVTAPTAKQLIYNDEGKAQELVNAGTTTGGTLVYAIGSASGPDEAYTPYIPTATKDGTYYVWYKVEGDDNYNSTEPQCIKVVIERSTKQLTDEAKANKVRLTDVYSDSVGTLTVEWQNDGYSDGYEVLLWNSRSMGYRSTVSRFTVDGTESDITIDGLIPGARYFVKVRGYKNIDGKRVYGKFSGTDSATVKRFYYGFGSGFGFGYGYGYGSNPYYNNPWNLGYSMNPFTRSNPWGYGYGYSYGRPYLSANSYRPMMSPYYFFRF